MITQSGIEVINEITGCADWRRLLHHSNEFFWMLHRQRSQPDRFECAKDDDTGANARAQQRNSRNRKSRRSHEYSPRISEIIHSAYYALSRGLLSLRTERNGNSVRDLNAQVTYAH
jgi:hypothetical protein